MARLLDWPEAIGINAMTPLSGPRVVGSGGSESLTGYVQTVAGVFGVWRWQIGVTAMKGIGFRRFRGTILGLHGGANALRVTFYDPDGLHTLRYANWSNGMPWSNGAPWSCLADWVSPTHPAVLGATEVRLAATTWGHQLGVGDWFGFTPYHFGLYVVTEVLAPGRYRIWPPLRKDVTTDDYAHLKPVMAMRLESENAASAARGLEVAEAATLTLIEVEHRDVVDFFSD